jgi:N-acyl-phosphatidylethanolamine-hydrolysing phospholipase D
VEDGPVLEPHPPTRVLLPFLLRRLRASLSPRPGAAPIVPFDREALSWNPALTWIGHATFFVRMDGAAFLTDPVFSERASPVSFAGPRRLVPPGVRSAELPALDFVLLSHDHYDHTDMPSVRALAARGATLLVPRGLADLVRPAGAPVIELGWWESAVVAGLRVHCVPARHFSGRGLRDRNRRLWAGWVVEGPTGRFYHAGDTAYFPGFGEIRRRLGPISLAALPIGAYLPPSIMARIHMNPEEAVQATLDLQAEEAVGMRFGTFDLTDEPLDEPPRRFLAEAERRGLGERAFVMKVGETRRFLGQTPRL